MTLIDPYAETRRPVPDPYEVSRVLEDTPNDWTIMILTAQGDEYMLDQWTSLSITDTHDGPRATMEVNGLEPMIDYMRMLVTELLLIRNEVPLYRLMIADSEDTMTRDADVVKFDCVGYEKLLERRILHLDWVLVDEDIDAAWRLIDYTQQRWPLGITRGTLTPGVTRQRTLNVGDTILASVNEFAEAETGFDWWIDVNRVWWAQKPRRGKVHDVEWRWGNEIAELVRTSEMDDYASLVMVTGAQNETRIPDGAGGETVYPPPPPATVELATKPYGLWERSVAYSNVVTPASLLEKANWHLNDAANIRPTYKVTLEPGIWTPAYGIGDVVNMRIEGAPRINFRVPVRIEEISITVTAAGEETVTMSLRAEQIETHLGPAATKMPTPEPDALIPGGRTVQRHHLRPWDDLAAQMRRTDERIARRERTPGTGIP